MFFVSVQFRKSPPRPLVLDGSAHRHINFPAMSSCNLDSASNSNIAGGMAITSENLFPALLIFYVRNLERLFKAHGSKRLT